MKIIRKVQHGDEFWAQRRDGAWLKWSAVASEWVERPGGPAFEIDDSPGFAASTRRVFGAPAIVGGPRDAENAQPFPLLRSRIPTNRVDEWWVRNFPPSSGKRLLFFLCVIPPVALLVILLRAASPNIDFSWPQLWLVTLSMEFLFGLMWISGIWERADDYLGTADHRNDPDWDPTPAPTGSNPPLPIASQEPRNHLRDFVITLSIAFVGTTIMALMFWSGDAFSAVSLLTSFTSAFLFAVVVLIRHTVWSVVLLSILVGLPAALLLHLFTIFLSDSNSILWMWPIASILAFTIIYPTWHSMRELGLIYVPGKSQARREMPLWVIVTGAFGLSIIATFFANAPS